MQLTGFMNVAVFDALLAYFVHNGAETMVRYSDVVRGRDCSEKPKMKTKPHKLTIGDEMLLYTMKLRLGLRDLMPSKVFKVGKFYFNSLA